MARCSGCGGDRCSCRIIAGANVQVTGSGTAANPYQIASTGGEGGGATIPVGTIWAFAGAVAPTGWLLCTGAAVSRSGFAALFGVIGTTYGPGDGSTTFSLPDLAGRGPFGADATHPLGSTGGNESVVLGVGQMPVHAHGVQHSHRIDHAHGASASAGAVGDHHHAIRQSNTTGGNNQTVARGGAGERDLDTDNKGSHSHGISVSVAGVVANSGYMNERVTTDNTGGTDPVNLMDPYTAVSFIIKT